MNITIGSISLTEKNSPKVNVKYEYYRTDNNIIVGGKRVLTVSGYVSKEDDGSQTGSIVMTELKNIRDAGRNQNGKSCVNVNIPGFYSGMARLDNINIDQGPDPSWVNQGGFTISVEAPLTSIPPNNFGITAQDYVKSLSFSEKIELGEDSHGFVYLDNKTLTKSFVKFICRVSVEVDPICQGGTSKSLVENIIRKFLKTAPTHRLLTKYSSWKVHLQDRSYEVVNETSANFNAESILLHPSAGGSSGYVELNFKHNKNYTNDDESKIISGNIKGLISVPWSDIITLDSNNSGSKLGNAENIYSSISSTFKDISSWKGIEYELFRYNCPATRGDDPCNATQDPKNKKDCIKPSVTNVNRSRTEGSIDFSFEWVNSDCAKNSSNSTTIEYNIDDQKMQPTVVDFTIPTIGILLQNVNCYTARKISFTSTLTFASTNCPDANQADCGQNAKLQEQISLYFSSRSMNEADFLLTEHTKTRNTKSTILKKSFVSLCTTPLTN